MGVARGVGWVCLTALTLLEGSFPSTVFAADTYVDCSVATDGDGSPASPLNALGSGFDLGPGDRLLQPAAQRDRRGDR